MSLRATSLSPRCSNLARIPPTRLRWIASGFRRTNVRSRGIRSRPLLRLLRRLRLHLGGLLLVRAPAALHPLRRVVEPPLQRVPSLRGLEERHELLRIDLLDVLPAVLLAVPWGDLDLEGVRVREPREMALRVRPREAGPEAVVDQGDDVRGDRLALRGLDGHEGARLRLPSRNGDRGGSPPPAQPLRPPEGLRPRDPTGLASAVQHV